MTMNPRRFAKLALVATGLLALGAAVATGQQPQQLTRVLSTNGLNDSALVTVCDSTKSTSCLKGASLDQWRKALARGSAFDSMRVAGLSTFTGGATIGIGKRLTFLATDTIVGLARFRDTIGGTPVWLSIQTFATGQLVDSATGAARAPAGSLTGATLAAGVTASSLTSFGSGARTDSATGAARSQTLTTARTLWAQSFNGSANVTARPQFGGGWTSTGRDSLLTGSALVFAASDTVIGKAYFQDTVVIGGTNALFNSNGVGLTVVTTGSATPKGIASAQYSNDTFSAHTNMLKARGTEASPSIVTTGDNLGRLRFYGYTGAGTPWTVGSEIFTGTTGTVNNTPRLPTFIAMAVTPDSTTNALTENFRMTANAGAIFTGVGPTATTAPASLFDVIGSSSSTTVGFDGRRTLSIINTNATANNMASLAFRSMDAGANTYTGASVRSLFTARGASTLTADLVFSTNNASTEATENMRLKSTGTLVLGQNEQSTTAAPVSDTLRAPIAAQQSSSVAGASFIIAGSNAVAGSATSSVANGGGVSILLGSAARLTSTSGAGVPGNFTVTSGQPNSAVNGGQGSDFSFVGNTSVTQTQSASTVGRGSNLNYTGGVGSANSSTGNASTGGTGGGVVSASGAGGAATGSSAGNAFVGGLGGGESHTMGAGGAATTGAGTKTGGAAGPYAVAGATGGAATSTTTTVTVTGGAGSDISHTAGNGGNATGAGGTSTAISGRGGDATVASGSPGTAASGNTNTTGRNGMIQFAIGALGNIARFDSAGMLSWNTTNTYDIGASGGSQPRNVYVGTNVVTGNGSAAAPSHTVTGSTGSGMYRFGADTIGWATAGVHSLRLSGGATPTLAGGAGSLIFLAGTGNSRTMTLQSSNSSGTATSFLVGSGDTLKFSAHASAASLTAAGATKNSVCIDATTHEIMENAASSCLVSSLRYKENVAPLSLSAAQRIVKGVRPVTFRYKADKAEAIGAIAEQADSIDHRLVSRDPQGRPNSINYEQLTVSLLAVVKDQQRQLDSLGAVVAKLSPKRVSSAKPRRLTFNEPPRPIDYTLRRDTLFRGQIDTVYDGCNTSYIDPATGYGTSTLVFCTAQMRAANLARRDSLDRSGRLAQPAPVPGPRPNPGPHPTRKP